MKKGYDYFQVTQQPPKFKFCEGQYKFGSVIGDELPTNPMANCPTFAPMPELVAAKSENDLNKMVNLISEGYYKTCEYSDGGMHRTCRKILFEKGTDFLSKRTSSTKVPISRSKAALSDPFLGN